MRRRMAAAALALALLAGVCAGCGSKGGESFGFALPAEPQQIDPQVARDTASLTVIAAVFEGLTAADENGVATPAAADWTVSEDGLTYTFHLKESYWSTVSVRKKETGFEQALLVTAYDFEFGIRRTADPATASPYAAQMDGIENADAVRKGDAPVTALGVRAVDNETLIIRLDAPNPDFPMRLSSPGFMPCNREFFDYTAGRYGLEAEYILTNGPFSVTGWTHRTAVNLKKNPFYHDSGNILPAAVRYRVTQTAEEDFELLRDGYLDGAAVPPDKLDDAKESNLQLVALADTVRYLWMNNEVEALKNADIRRALRDAIEWETLWDSLPEGYAPAAGFVPPAATVGGRVFRADSNALPFHTDAAQAKRELADGLAALQTEQFPTLTLLASEQEGDADFARYIAQSFSKNLSVRCTLELTDSETLAARVQAGNYQLAIADMTGRGLTAYENLAQFTSGASVNNCARFSSKTYDRQYADAGAAAADIAALEQTLYADCPSLPLGFFTRYYGLLPNTAGVTVRPFNGGVYGALLSFRQANRTERQHS